MNRMVWCLLCGLLLTVTNARATVYRVDAANTNGGNGSSWSAAINDLQAAIDAAANNDEIWVKAGTYKPTRDPNGYTVTGKFRTFVLINKDVKLYGGFFGNETQLSQRNVATNVTILSGDINAVVNGVVEDAYHVMLLMDRTNACVIDGFTISGGVAGGGLYYQINNPRAYVYSYKGGGIYNDNSDPTITNCTFSGNTATYGAGIYNNSNSEPVLSNCVFSGNTSDSRGAGIYNENTNVTVSTCTFTNNTAEFGAGIYNWKATPTIMSCTFSNNTATHDGGGMYNDRNTYLTVSNCSFYGNTGSQGGGLYEDSTLYSTISNCIFSANTADSNSNGIGLGGGMVARGSRLSTVSNCLFSGNTTSNYGGGIYMTDGSPTFTSCTFSGNTARNYGGGVYCFGGNSIQAVIQNCILYGNTGGPVNRQNIYKDDPAGSLTVSYSLIGDYSATAANKYTSGARIVAGNPLFVNAASPAGADGMFRTADDGLRIGCTSPARDLGTGTTPATDILGNSRVGTIDMGAYENLGTGCPNIQYVDGSVSVGGNGYSWVSPRKDLQDAINSVPAFGQVWVKGGTYKPTQDANGNSSPADNRDKTFYFKRTSLQLIGGFPNTASPVFSDRNPVANVTTLSGDLDVNGTNDAYHVVVAVNQTNGSIDGFTISGGRATGSGPFNVTTPTATIYRSDGGGLMYVGSSLQISNCAIRNNTSSVFGGGMYNVNSTPTLASCSLSNNTAGERGGAIANNGSNTEIYTSVFSTNTATIRGGGMYNNGGIPKVYNSVFNANTTGNLGGGMYNESGNPIIMNCVFNANTATSTGGAMYNESGYPASYNCTFYANTATTLGGGIYSTGASSGSISNCILFGNTGGPANRQNMYKDAGSGTWTVASSLIGDYSATAANNFSATNSFAGDPVFVNAASPAGSDGVFLNSDDGLRIDCSSPARDMGTGTIPGSDILNATRVGTIDIGAYENPGVGCSNLIQYVDSGKAINGNGYSWGGAKRDLQDAINAVAAGGEVWVKSGTYLPTQDANGSLTPADNRDKTFYLTTKDVRLYGGFSGTETTNTQRDPATNLTTLSGDLDGAGGTADAYHVLLTLNRTTATVVDGFTISGGRATGSTTFTVTTPSATVNQKFGGGVLNQLSSPGFSTCVFKNNTATTLGGGMSNTATSNGAITGCTFSGNSSDYGGGLYCSQSSPTLSRVIFSGNSAGTNGGGLMAESSSQVVFSNGIITGNTASKGAGGYIDGSNPVLNSLTVSGNTATTQCGGIWCGASTGGSVTNAILYGNSGGTKLHWHNLFNNGGSGIQTVSASVVGNYDSIAASYTNGGGITSQDPLFMNAANPAGADGLFGTADDGLRIGCASAARDMGTGTTPTTDFAGSSRVGIIDMGAYENSGTGCPNIQYVDAGMASSGNGYSWGGAKKDLQEAINTVATGGEVWVKAGTYLPTQDANGSLTPADNRDKTFYLTTKDVRLYGGFSGTETINTQRNSKTNLTTLSGDLDGTSGTNDAYHVLVTFGRTNDCVVDGFTISGGRANGVGTFGLNTPSPPINRKFGGGVINQLSSPSFSNCVFKSNTATTLGGGMSNTATSNGAITGCTFSGNSSDYGGGLYCNQSSPTLSRVIFSGNSANLVGGGLMAENSSHIVFTNGIIVGNTASKGGGMQIDGSNPVLSSLTVSGNTATSSGGGIWCGSSTGGSITNSIIYANSANSIQGDWQNLINNGGSGTQTVSASVVGNYNSATAYYTNGGGISNQDPLFVNAGTPAGADGLFGTADDGLALRPCSPAINAGTTPSPALATDFLNNNRVGAYDLGAYEYQSTASAPTLATATTTSTQNQYTNGATSFGDCNTTIAMLFSTGSQPVQGAVSAKVYVQTTTPMLGQTPYVRRYYDITPTTNPNSATAQVTLYFTQADFDTYNSVRGSLPSLPINAADAANYKANIRVTQEHGTSVSGLPGSYSGWAGSGPAKVLINPTAISWNNVASRWEVTFPITGFSGFFLNSASAAPLPLKLIAFNAGKVHGAQNKVEWITASEDGNTVFTVERSADAKTFEALGTRTGTGLRQGSRYRFDDYTPNGDAYYRLKIREASGVETYSNTILVKGEATLNPGISIAPNPTSGLVSISCTDQALLGKMVTVTGMDGRVLRQFVLDAITSLDVQPWAAGIYLLHLPDETVLRLLKH